MTIAITGASGQLGGLTATRLLEVADPTEVVLLSRNPGSLDDFVRRGAQARAVDFNDPSTLPAAFDGVGRLLLVSADTVGDRLAGHLAAIEAAASAGVGHIVYTSVPNPVDDNPALVTPDHKATEDALRSSGVVWTFLRNNLYADMQVPTLAQAAASGQLITNAGHGRTACVTRADCAAAAVAVLTTDGHENKAYDITGPQSLSARDLAALAGPAVEVVNVDDDAYVSALVGAGLPTPVAQLLASFGAAARGGYLETVSSAVHDLTGRPPTPLNQLLG
jgi:NAD(P)H dehydrogenase (quinone)